jgi:hypothetical protein
MPTEPDLQLVNRWLCGAGCDGCGCQSQYQSEAAGDAGRQRTPSLELNF